MDLEILVLKRIATLLAVIVIVTSIGTSATGAAPSTHFAVEPLADGVYAVIRKEPLGFAVHGNTLFVVCDRDVVVVDTDFTRQAAQEVLEAIRAVTPKPVKYVINTHWHDDHVMGNQVYRDAFPDVEFIAQRNTRDAILTDAVANRKQQLDGGPAATAQFRKNMDSGLSLTGGPMSDEERAMLASSVEIFDQYLKEAPAAVVVPPTITFDNELTLHHGGRTIELHWFGPANTKGDTVIYLPAEKIVATGDLVVAPIPFTFNSNPREWVGALDKVLGLGASTIVPGHGPVMRDTSYVVLVRRLLESANTQAKAAVERGETLEVARKSIVLTEFRDAMAGSSAERRLLFANFVAGPLVARAFAEASQK
jgi:glyoxylase-like metal-dependent hydrolase (beta-lactamase superfamily II)